MAYVSSPPLPVARYPLLSGPPQQQQQHYQSQQPMPTMGMKVGGGNRNAAGKPLDSNGKREWSHGLCGCFEACGTCESPLFALPTFP